MTSPLDLSGASSLPSLIGALQAFLEAEDPRPTRPFTFTVPQLAAGDTWRSEVMTGLPTYLHDATWVATVAATTDGTLSIETSLDTVTWTTLLSTATAAGAATLTTPGADVYFRVVFVCGGAPQTGTSLATLTIQLPL